MTNNPCALPGYKGAVDEDARKAHGANWDALFRLGGGGIHSWNGGEYMVAQDAPPASWLHDEAAAPVASVGADK